MVYSTIIYLDKRITLGRLYIADIFVR